MNYILKNVLNHLLNQIAEELVICKSKKLNNTGHTVINCEYKVIE